VAVDRVERWGSGPGGQRTYATTRMVENVTTILTRVPLLSLVSRSSSFSLKGRSPAADDVRRRFGVDYMIEGSLQRLERQVRANVQLIATETG